MKFAGITQSGEVRIMNGTSCTPEYCKEYGCDFPRCAKYDGEEFESEEAARRIYKNITFVKLEE